MIRLLFLLGLGLFGLFSYNNLKGDLTSIQSRVQAVRTAGEIQVQDLWAETNKARRTAGVAPLALDERLNDSAGQKCRQMQRDGWGHVGPDGKHGYEYIETAIPTNRGGSENLADSQGPETASGITKGWLESPSHREALLEPKYTAVGYAVCKVEGHTYTVQHFVTL